ncbi:hypothetical protein C471_14163 [Halorubrum saccharovorum DSM 1137]|uniref:Uncharacterized protein n=1 Tax=Halorubrum saccharovorum DSM 1137 TaxID=1227484 RepID=M0DPF9_9EURY|nr:hypothetical protein [Halorubrum saccharovorum]ELZ36733.1 hypothetical protein C471_14163 [Halorubrum saccharovorum DSM 1137]
MTETESTTDAFDRDSVRSASRVAIAALALVGVLYLFTLLPGVDRLVPLTPITVAAVASAVVTVAVVALLLFAAPKVASLTRAALHRTDAANHVERIAENGGAMAYWLVVLAAVLVAHRGLAGAVVPLLDGFAWAYDAAFLIGSFVPLVFVVARLSVTVDPLSELVADRVSGPESTAEADDADDADDVGDAGDAGESPGIDPAGSHGHSIEERWGADDEFGDEADGGADDESTTS